MIGMDVLAGLRLHLLNEGAEQVGSDIRLAAIERSLGNVQLGYKTVGNALVVDVVRHGSVFTQGGDGGFVRAFVTLHGESRNGQGETE